MTQTKRYISCADTAKLVRTALKEAFSGVKFSVRSSTYSGGASISVAWCDGPTGKEVQPVLDRFRGASFDGMIDLKSYHDSLLNGERVHFGADYIFASRHTSAEFLQRLLPDALKSPRLSGLGLTLDDFVVVPDYTGKYANVQGNSQRARARNLLGQGCYDAVDAVRAYAQEVSADFYATGSTLAQSVQPLP